ncbi:MAG: hypothetical protein KatS3mg118_0896 [Paracoccaceae bacterium]|nr:MAG: hypothetical protein KatS3mg118_0896 [Paracoccaceae bacterium]
MLVRFLDRVASAELDRGSDHFEPSTLAVTGIDTGNDAANVIPARARAMLNIRFNDRHRGADLLAWLRGQAARAAEGSGVTLTVEASWSDAFLTEPGPFIDLVAGAVEAETGLRPVLSTSGGTSDARFIKDHCPVAEFGLVGQTMHQVDERAAVADIRALAAIYRRILDGFLA